MLRSVMRNREHNLLVWVGVPLLLIGWNCKGQSAPVSSNAWLTIQPTKSSYDTVANDFDSVELQVMVTNRGNKACYASNMPAATFVVDSMTIDGVAQVPTLGAVHFGMGSFAYILLNSYKRLEPGKSVSGSIGGWRRLSTLSSGEGSAADSTRWPTTSPGSYVMKFHPIVPVGLEFRGELCSIPADPVEVRFVVNGAQ